VLDTKSWDLVSVGAVGFGPPTMFFSERSLRAIDWRQQDALTDLALGIARYRTGDRLTRCLYAFAEGTLLAGFFLLVAYVESSGLRDTGGLFSAFVIAGTIPIGRHAISRLYTGYDIVRTRQLGERFAAGLTGDPLAIMVALHTLLAIHMAPPSRASQRLNLLEQLRGQPGHWAPWADNPVPSAIPLVWNGHTLTAPLESAPPPAPVPTAPYPEREPVTLAARVG
jgi:hypothetical protein